MASKILIPSMRFNPSFRAGYRKAEGDAALPARHVAPAPLWMTKPLRPLAAPKPPVKVREPEPKKRSAAR
jgi:hypothetical protein